ncbi:4-hydroxy-tetrahydrodipicolinate reductase [Halorussus gelatinilyticus]|uniref:4-hydroxy-tetrahydrodipicolinate reductase n=1 Tax=Halorussus gelatinilyticus TaxID=2937524 RepID=A0A8U0IEW8_9EURY|nr:4-hydroxy-tetrahydrodipicolinate reductase [Halorussus gelatinilyticus]UPV99294.1 4-hydroxy-tetrahydrodipicolinate reductase [Halorussus gelatinilyticus]
MSVADDGESASVSVAVTGATGEMGRAVVDAAADRADASVAFAVNRDPEEGASVEGVPVDPAREFDRLLAEREPDVLVDFTGPASSQNYVAVATEAGVASVVGTTGFDESGEEALRECSRYAPVLKASNFGRGVHALRSAVEAAVADLPGYDVEVTETHHNRKRDAPSGTANAILETIEDARAAGSEESGERVHGREGEAPREAGEIGVHARRAGTITGEHEVLLAGNHEELRLTHRAEDRGVFAEGALDAAVWLAGREPGWYDFADVIDGADGETNSSSERGDDR